jgi:hypothetical protein
MGQAIKFSTAITPDNKLQFILDEITITIDECSDINGKHEIATPRTATAYYTCLGKKYVVTNVEAMPTVEDWYAEELLPKFRMLKLLIDDIQVQGSAPGAEQ